VRKVWSRVIEVLSLVLAFDVIAFAPLAILEGIRWLFGERGAKVFEVQVAVGFLLLAAYCLAMWGGGEGSDWR